MYILVSHVKLMMAVKMCAREGERACVLEIFSLFCLHSLFANRIFFPHFLRNSSCRFAQVGKINATEQKYITFTKAKRTLTHSLTARHTQQFVRILHLKIESCDGDGDGMRPRIFLCLIIIFARNT